MVTVCEPRQTNGLDGLGCAFAEVHLADVRDTSAILRRELEMESVPSLRNFWNYGTSAKSDLNKSQDGDDQDYPDVACGGEDTPFKWKP